MKPNGVSPWLYFFLVFAGGIATGFFGDRALNARTVSANVSPRTAQEWKRHYMGDLKTRCNLTDTQLTQVDDILERTHKQADELRDRIAPELDALHNQQVLQVRELMTDAQRPAYDHFRAERDAQRKANRH
jgi:hypothetical protein